MGRVKLNAKHEYEYLANYKILQNLFKAHKIDKVSGHVVRKNRCSDLFIPANTRREASQMQDAVCDSFGWRTGWT